MLATISLLFCVPSVHLIAVPGISLRSDEGQGREGQSGSQEEKDPYDTSLRLGQGDLKLLGTFTTRRSYAYGDTMRDDRLTLHVGLLSNKTSAYEKRFNDPMWTKQWYLQDYRTEDSPVFDHNVVPVYNRKINGTGVTVAVVDEGIEGDHPDLIDNYIAGLSYDYICKRTGCQPGKETTDEGGVRTLTHGTQAAGVIAMKADNGVCGVGVAFGAKVAGVVVMGPDHIASLLESTDSILAKGLVHKLNDVDIYSCSWYFQRLGRILYDHPKMIYKAIKKGVTNGRYGKGAIYVFPAGNSASAKMEDGTHVPLDSCATDGLSNNPNVIVIAGASQWGRVTRYSEACTNVFATAYSSAGYPGHEKVVATDANGQCTNDFGGTSAATAIASGIIALVLSANKALTYRDVMHLIAYVSEAAPLAENNPTWYMNAAGFAVSNHFGFGLLNAENMVLMAQNNWMRVPDKKICVVDIKINKKIYFKMEKSQVFILDTDACQKSSENGVFFLEQVELATTIRSLTKIERGDFSIYLTSPSGTTSVLMKPRAPDRSSSGFKNWSITNVHYWGENPSGVWKIHAYIHDYGKTWPMLNSIKWSSSQAPSRSNSFERTDSTKNQPVSSGPWSRMISSAYPFKNEKAKAEEMSGVVKGFTLTLHGTKEKPNHYPKEPPYRGYAPYNAFDQALVLKSTCVLC